MSSNTQHTTPELIKKILAMDTQSDAAWELISELHMRGGETEFEQAKALCASSDNPIKRELGVNILAQLGADDDCYREESIAILIPLLNDSDALVIAVTGHALGHRNVPEAIDMLLPLITHKNDDIRLGVTMALGNLEDKRAIQALITLSSDDDFDVRNWATFNLSAIEEVDTPALRAALQARLEDPEVEIRGEALVGLALRNEANIHPYLLQELTWMIEQFQGDWAIEAAELTPSSEYLPLLKSIRKAWGKEFDAATNELVQNAIKACEPDA